MKVTSVHKLMQENTNNFFVFQDSSIPAVWGDIYPCICDHQTAYIAYWRLLFKKMKQHGLKFHASGQLSIRVEPRGMVQPITHNLVRRKQDGSDHTM